MRRLLLTKKYDPGTHRLCICGSVLRLRSEVSTTRRFFMPCLVVPCLSNLYFESTGLASFFLFLLFSLGFNGSNTCVCASTSNIQTLSFLKQRLPKMKVVAVLVIMVAVAASAFASCPNPPTVDSINVTACKLQLA